MTTTLTAAPSGTLRQLIELAESAISNVESAERETNWGNPTFGPTPSEELQEQLEALHEPLADLYIHLSGKRVHASDCATSCAPAEMPKPCDCDVSSDAELPSELLTALYQYRDDLRYPPAPDSVTRRLAMVEALIAKATGK